MGRIRTIKPEFHAHEELSALPAETHLFAAALVNYCDDEGYFNANPVLVKAGTNPLRADKTKVDEQLTQLEAIGYIEMRTEGKKAIGRIIKFDEHQRVSHPSPSKLKAKFESSGNIPEPLRPEGKGKEGNGKEQGKAASGFVLPIWIDRAAWECFDAMRKKNSPLTDQGRVLCVKKLEAMKKAGHDPTLILNNSTMNGWRGLFEPKGETNGTNRGFQGRGDRAQSNLIAAFNSIEAEYGSIEGDHAEVGGDVSESWRGDGPGTPGVVLEGHR